MYTFEKNRFHCDHQLQVHMHDVLYFYPKTMSEDDYFTDTKKC